MARLRQIEDEGSDRRITRSPYPVPLSRQFNAAKHGTRAKYTSGCGCEPCRNADREYQRGRRR